jgi:calcium/proton exchanger cax
LASSPDGHLPDQSVELRNLPSIPSSAGSKNCTQPTLLVRGAGEPEEEKGNTKNEVKSPHLHLGVATGVFAVTIVLLYFCVNATVDNISALSQHRLSETFVGLILLPIPNCNFAPISLAFDDSLEQTMKYTVGRSIQTALLVEPMVVLLAWWTGVSDVPRPVGVKVSCTLQYIL